MEAGVNVQTLRYYERRGLLARPARTVSGYRQYADDAIRRVRFVKHAQELGFTLKEVEELLRLRDGNAGTCGEVRAAAEIKRSAIDDKIASLRAMRRALDVLVASCERNRAERSCPLLEAFGTGEAVLRSDKRRGTKKSTSGGSHG
jgi:Hg(II)-responsive transcriptional regulator